MTDHRSSPCSPNDAAGGFAELTHWAAGLRFADLPDDVVRRALLVLADDIGAMIAVRDDPQVVAVRESLLSDGEPAEGDGVRRRAPARRASRGRRRQRDGRGLG